MLFVQHVNYPAAPQHRYMPLSSLPSIHAAPDLPDPNVCCSFPAFVAGNSMPPVGTSVNLSSAPLAPFNNPYVPILHGSSTHLQAATVGSQAHVKPDFMQTKTFKSSTCTVPIFVTPNVLPLPGATTPNPLCWGGPPHPTAWAPSLHSRDLIKQLSDAITNKRKDTLARVECVMVQW